MCTVPEGYSHRYRYEPAHIHFVDVLSTLKSHDKLVGAVDNPSRHSISMAKTSATTGPAEDDVLSEHSVRSTLRLTPVLERRRLVLSDAHTHWHETDGSRPCHSGESERPALAPSLNTHDPAVGTYVICGCHPSDWDAVNAHWRASMLCSGKIVYQGYGVHPWWSAPFADDSTRDAMIHQLTVRLLDEPTASVGEIGLDKSPKALASSSLEVQQVVFQAQLLLAIQLGRAVSIHCVRAHEEILAALLRAVEASAPHHPPPRGILMHSWPGPPHATQQILSACQRWGTRVAFSFQGVIVPVVAAAMEERYATAATSGRESTTGVNGAASILSFDSSETTAATRGASKQTMSVLAQLPLPNLCVETDAPYQSFSTGESHKWAEYHAAVMSQFSNGSAEDFTTMPISLDGCVTTAAALSQVAARTVDHSPNRVTEVLLAAACWRRLKAKSCHSTAMESNAASCISTLASSAAGCGPGSSSDSGGAHALVSSGMKDREGIHATTRVSTASPLHTPSSCAVPAGWPPLDVIVSDMEQLATQCANNLHDIFGEASRGKE